MDITATVLDLVINYGAPMVCLTILLSSIGTPIPGTLIVIAAGAFIRQELLDIYSITIMGLIGAIAGDSIVYGVGRFASNWIEQKLGGSSSWLSAKESFERRGGITIYFTHWLVPPLGVPTNLIAGGSGYAYSTLLAFDLAGRATWFLLYGGLGYIFGAQWELITDFLSNFSGLIISVLAILAGIYLIVRYWRTPAKAEVQKII